MRLLILVFMLTGCQTLSQSPTIQNCDRVEYIREDTKINIVAECQVPRGGGIL